MELHLSDSDIVSEIVRPSLTPFSELVVARDAAIRTGADLAGKTIATPALNDFSALVISAWVDRHGGDARALKFVELPINAMQAAFESRRIDAALMNDIPLATALAAGVVRILAPALDVVAPEFPFTGWFCTGPWAAAHRELAQRFARVIADAASYTNAHHVETAALAASFTGMPIEVVERSPRSDAGTRLRRSQVQPLIDLAAKYHVIPEPFPAREIVDDGTSLP